MWKAAFDDFGATSLQLLALLERLVTGQRPQTKVVGDGQVGARMTGELLLQALVGARSASLGEDVVRSDVQRRVPGSARALPKRPGQAAPLILVSGPVLVR